MVMVIVKVNVIFSHFAKQYLRYVIIMKCKILYFCKI